MASEQRRLAEILARTERPDHLLIAAEALDDLDLPGEDHVQAVGAVALLEHNFARLVVGCAAPLAPPRLSCTGWAGSTRSLSHETATRALRAAPGSLAQ